MIDAATKRELGQAEIAESRPGLPLVHVLGMGAVTAGIVLCTMLPFLPGPYDGLTVPLSAAALFFGKAGLLLVPVGVLWLAYELRGGSARGEGTPLRAHRHLVRTGALIATAVVLFLVCLGAVLGSGPVSTVAVMTLWACVVRGAAVRWRQRGAVGTIPERGMPLYLIVVPIAVAFVQLTLAGPLAEFSRRRVIENSMPLIADIERYHATRGHYPPSLLSRHEDYDPGVMGVRRYQYEARGDAYNVVFDQPSFVLGTHEYVVYNPLDEQVMTSHNEDLLRLTPTQLESTRGFYAVRATSHPHWKSFLFD